MSRGVSRAVVAWTYEEGPPRRGWRWYLAVFAIGLGLAGLMLVTVQDDLTAAGSMLLWVCVVTAFSLAPHRTFAARIDRQLLTVTDVKRRRVIIERNLHEFGSVKLAEIPADRLNPVSRRAILRPRDGRIAVELRLSGDDSTDETIYDRIAAVVPLAPDIAPNLWERFDALAQRWIGWR